MPGLGNYLPLLYDTEASGSAQGFRVSLNPKPLSPKLVRLQQSESAAGGKKLGGAGQRTDGLMTEVVYRAL